MNYDELLKLHDLALKSYEYIIKYSGSTEVLLKWPDLSESLIKYGQEPSEQNYSIILDDLTQLIFSPLKIILDSLSLHHQELTNVKSKIVIDHNLDLISLRKQYIKYINQLSGSLELIKNVPYHRIED